MSKRYGYSEDTIHQAIIFELGSKASITSNQHGGTHTEDTPGLVVGSSEWGWITEDSGRRICAALQFFSETETKEIERQANERFPKMKTRNRDE